MTLRYFPVLGNKNPRECPTRVPWGFVAEHAERAQKNHGQSLEELARRGGLSPAEMLLVIEDKPAMSLSDVAKINRTEVCDRLREHLSKWHLQHWTGSGYK